LILATAPKTASGAPVDFTGKEPLGKCPKCGSNVFDGGMNYVCENRRARKRPATFKTGQNYFAAGDFAGAGPKLLATGKTDLLKGLFSKKNNRKFEAFLVVKDGKTAFEFAPREKKGKARPKRTAAEN
jgi:DNA topoisomerase-3